MLGKRSVFFSFVIAALAVGCDFDSHGPALPDGAASDAGTDASRPDATEPDAAEPDAALPDAAVPDVAVPDADPPDADPPDADPPDANLPDAGPPPLGGFVIAEAYVAGNAVNESFLVRIRLDGGPAINLTPTTGQLIVKFQVTPEGKHVVYVARPSSPGQGRQRLYVLPTDGSQPPMELNQPVPENESVGFAFQLSPHGDRVAYRLGVVDRGLWTVRLDGSERVRVADGENLNEWMWHPNGEHIIFTTPWPVPEIHLTCATSDCRRVVLPGRPAYNLRFSPEGEHLMFLVRTTPQSQALWVLDFPSEEAREIAPAVYNNIGPDYWSPDGERLVYQAMGGSPSDFNVHTACADGSCNVTLPLPFTVGAANDQLAWSPDGRHIIAMAKRLVNQPLRLFSLCADGSCVHELPHSDNLLPRWSPDGHVIHGGLMPDSTVREVVADCANDDCPRVSLTNGSEGREPPLFLPYSSRYAITSDSAMYVSEGLGQPSRQLLPYKANPLAFDPTGLRIIFLKLFDHGSIRIDGTDQRRFADQIMPSNVQLRSFRVIVR